MMKILVCDPLAQEGLDILSADADITVDVKVGMGKDELLSTVPDYDAILVRSETKITADVLSEAVKLKAVGRAGVGVDNIDVAAATRHGVIVINAPDGNTNAAAEHTLALIASLARNIPQANAALKNGKWARKDYVGVELKGKTLGVIGVGRIGSTVASRAMALGMKVVAYDPYISAEQLKAKGYVPMTLDEIYATADFITVHMPLNAQTKGLIGPDAFAAMKDGVRVVNVARGGIIDEEALLQALKNGKVAGAALDVYQTEPCTDSPLFTLGNVIATPHLGASTVEAQTNVAVSVAYEILDILHGQLPQNAVNMAAVGGEEYERVKPYMGLAQKLGQVLAGIVDKAVDSIEVTYGEAVASLKTSLLTGLVLKGYLDATSDEETNLVNVSLLAADRGIKVKESKEVLAGGGNRIAVSAVIGKKTVEVAGVLSTSETPRIIKIDEYDMDVQPSDYALLVWHLDRPNLVGPTTTLLGQEGVNIASMQVSRLSPGGDALMVINLDSAMSDEVLSAISHLPGVIRAKLLTLI